MIDTHIHIDEEAYAMDREEVIARQREAGVEAMIVPGVNAKSIEGILDVCQKHKGYCFPALGFHPQDVFPDDYKEHITGREISGEAGTGGATETRDNIKIAPELVSGMEIAAKAARIGGGAVMGRETATAPELISGVEVTSETGVGAISQSRDKIGVAPELVSGMEITGKAKTGGSPSVHQRAHFTPELVSGIEITSKTHIGGAAREEEKSCIAPELTTEIEATNRTKLGAWTNARQAAKVAPALIKGLETKGIVFTVASADGKGHERKYQANTELSSEMEATAETGIGGGATHQIVEIFPG